MKIVPKLEWVVLIHLEEVLIHLVISLIHLMISLGPYQ